MQSTTRDRHTALMTRMAATLGADLEGAEMRGALPRGMRDDMLAACTSCAAPGACSRWLERTPRADAAPDYCRNRDTLRALAAE